MPAQETECSRGRFALATQFPSDWLSGSSFRLVEARRRSGTTWALTNSFEEPIAERNS